jgi:hypothetical protein
MDVPASFRRPTRAEREQDRRRLALTQLRLGNEPDHAPEERKREELKRTRGRADPDAFRRAVEARRRQRENQP